jgi:hypothetical protein
MSARATAEVPDPAAVASVPIYAALLMRRGITADPAIARVAGACIGHLPPANHGEAGD